MLIRVIGSLLLPLLHKHSNAFSAKYFVSLSDTNTHAWVLQTSVLLLDTNTRIQFLQTYLCCCQIQILQQYICRLICIADWRKHSNAISADLSVSLCDTNTQTQFLSTDLTHKTHFCRIYCVAIWHNYSHNFCRRISVDVKHNHSLAIFPDLSVSLSQTDINPPYETTGFRFPTVWQWPGTNEYRTQ